MKPENASGEDAGSSRNNGKRPTASASPDKQQGPAKRSRVSRACDQCRASREKCDGTQPKCQTCTAQRRECTYNEQPKKRGIQPNYIRTLELIIAWQLKNLPGGENELAAHMCTVEDRVHRIISAKDGPGAEALHQGWRNSIVCRQIDQMLSGANIEHPPAHGALPPTQGTSPASAGRAESASAMDTASSVDLRSNGQGQSAPQLASGPVLSFGQSSNTVSRLKLPESTWTLLEYYFAFTHSWLPIAEKQNILKVVYTYPAEGVPYEVLLQDDLGYGELCSILALSASQLERSGQAHSYAQTGELQEVASRFVSAANPNLHISSLRVTLLQTINAIVLQDWTRAWFLIGRAIRVLLRIDTAPAGSGTNHSDLKPIKLAAFVIETSVACHLGVTSSHLRPDYVEKVGLLNEDGSEEWSPWHDPLAVTASKAPAMSFSTLNRLVRLTLQSFNAQGFLHTALQNVGSFELNRVSALAAIKADPTSDPLSSAPPNFRQASSMARLTLDSPSYRAVVALIQNSMASHDRLQPMAVVAKCEAGSLRSRDMSDVALNFADPQQQQLGYISIPNHTAESVLSANEEVKMWNSDGLVNAMPPNVLSGPTDGIGGGADIFEELALLDHGDANHNPQFMQNLGFAPDLDLAEFFGPDYQPSDPLLAYIQPPFLSNDSSGQRSSDPG